MKALLLLTVSLVPLAAHDSDRHWLVEDQETIHHSYAGGAGHKLVVDNFAGAIHVSGGGSRIEVTLVRHNRADSAEKLAEAKRDVKLEITEQGGEVKLHQDYHSHNSWHGQEGYRVEFDYDIQVPAGTALALHNFNSEIAVKGTSGDFSLHAFNGRIEADDVAGAGSVHTFNGPVEIIFGGDGGAGFGLRFGADQCGRSFQETARCRTLGALAGAADAGRGRVADGGGGPAGPGG